MVHSLGLVFGFVLLLSHKGAKHLKAINVLGAKGLCDNEIAAVQQVQCAFEFFIIISIV